MKIIENEKFEEERALYGDRSVSLRSCLFAGAADGESALKMARDVEIDSCVFELRYPLWHCGNIKIRNSKMTETCRAALWYTGGIRAENSVFGGIKALRECSDALFEDCTVSSSEFGWRCRGLSFSRCGISSEYVFMDSRDIVLKDVTLNGKYSFQYVENLTIENSTLDTKDAFWHAKNVTVKNSRIKGEYLGWYSEGLTLEGCEITGTQPLCCCRNLVLKDCTMKDADLAFEYSDVEAEINGAVLSVKNPLSGHIRAEHIGEIITSGSVMDCSCSITSLS